MEDIKVLPAQQTTKTEKCTAGAKEDSQMIGRICTNVRAKAVGQGRLARLTERLMHPNGMGPVLALGSFLQLAND
jgi:hypothetical protein